MDKSFAFKLFDLIDERDMTDMKCYKKANVYTPPNSLLFYAFIETL